jgi:tetratricopeptide (TPR) repeat protein
LPQRATNQPTKPTNQPTKPKIQAAARSGGVPDGYGRAETLYREAIYTPVDRPQFLGPNNHLAVAHNNLCVILDRNGQYHEAKRHCQAAMDVNSPNFFYPYTTMGKINEKFGLVDAARQNFVQSDKLRPDAGIRLHVATILPLVYDSMADYNARHKAYVDNVNELVRDKSLAFTNPLDQLITVASFYLAFFGKNDVKTYSQLAQILIQSCEKCVGW